MNTKHTQDKNPGAKSDVARREEEVLTFWNEHDIFNKSVAKDAPNGDFVFYDGPPFATGLPHYGHILAGTIKDAIPRFWTMNGKRVVRKWGWDCHGLPLENIIEKRLGLATKRDIEELGVKQFNEAARDAVLEYADDWKRIVPRMGRFVDMEDDYKTMDPSYTETVWWVFSELNKKGLVYEGFKSMHLCPRCGTTLSNFEVNLGYKDIKDVAVTVKLPLKDESGNLTDTSLLVWTTTPWTLPGNMAAAVHEDHDYVKVNVKTEAGDAFVILAKARLAQLGTEEYEILEEMKGSALVGTSYEPPFDYFKKAKEFLKNARLEDEDTGEVSDMLPIFDTAWKIYHADYVELGEEGTGAVHLAPAYGEEDMELAKAHGIPIVHHVGEDGRFLDHVSDFAGQLVKPKDDDDAEVTHLDTDIEILRALKERDVLVKKENITHSYPHCWRCDTPLLNYATTSWFVDVTKIKDELVAANEKVHWVPGHVGQNRFGKWLEGARDWAVSRQRYWGAPLPVWRNPKTKEYKVFGSLKELQECLPKSGNTYLLMRHGESESNAKNLVSTDVAEANPLTDTGKEQVNAAIAKLKERKIDRIIYSPFQRTAETATLVAAALKLSPEKVTLDERLGEIQLGEFNGQNNDVYRGFLTSGASWCDCSPIDGESWIEVKRRVGAFLYEIDRTYQNETILIISHNSPLRLLGTVHDGRPLARTDYDHDTEGKRYENAEVRELPFTPMPYNGEYALDFHRPYIDEIELVDEDGTKLERVPDVFDCWFESGSMPYGQHHYPFEHTDTFDPEKGTGYPANFIAEGLDQTRGWFYSLIVLGTALFKQAPYENVIVNGLVLAEDGKKMSKSLQNYPDPMELADRVGVDSMRFYLLSSPVIRGEDLNFSEKEVLELQRKNIGRLHNVLAMYEMYAAGEEARDDSAHVLDRWIVARLNELVASVTDGFKNYELDRASRPITEFIDDLSVWYLRRSRDRLKGEDARDKEAILSTLKHVLRTLALVMAPSMPFYAEYLWGRVKASDDAESVHLADWPAEQTVDQAVLEEMRLTREVVSLALEARAAAGIKIRQPLRTLSVQHEIHPEAEPYHELIRDEVNVKEIVSHPDQKEEVALDLMITPELQAEGDVRELIRQVQELRKKNGFAPRDEIVLSVQTSGDGERLLTQFETEITKTVGARTLQLERVTGTEITAGEHSFTVALAKVA